MDDVEQLRTRIAAAERRIRWLTAVTVVLGGALVVAAAGPDPTEDVVRTRGLVVVDEQGRERAVVGAPMTVVSEDPKLAETVGLAVKDTAGRLHVVVGARNPAVMPDGEVAERIAPGVGMTVYDPDTGQERDGCRRRLSTTRRVRTSATSCGPCRAEGSDRVERRGGESPWPSVVSG